MSTIPLKASPRSNTEQRTATFIKHARAIAQPFGIFQRRRPGKAALENTLDCPTAAAGAAASRGDPRAVATADALWKFVSEVPAPQASFDRWEKHLCINLADEELDEAQGLRAAGTQLRRVLENFTHLPEIGFWQEAGIVEPRADGGRRASWWAVPVPLAHLVATRDDWHTAMPWLEFASQHLASLTAFAILCRDAPRQAEHVRALGEALRDLQKYSWSEPHKNAAYAMRCGFRALLPREGKLKPLSLTPAAERAVREVLASP